MTSVTLKKLQYETTLKEIELIKEAFQIQLKETLDLIRVSAPLFLRKSSGLNDDLNGVERKVSFTPKIFSQSQPNALHAPPEMDSLEVVQSLAKWKRYALDKYGIKGLYADMNAIRMDEDIDNIHSIYVDQWDWEHVIMLSERNHKTLESYANAIFHCIKAVDVELSSANPTRDELLHDVKTLTFIDLDELEDEHGIIDSEVERLCKEHKAIFLTGIGYPERAPDYDDWSLNGDILVWNPVLEHSLELSSMGIRVNAQVLEEQMKEANCWEQRKDFPYHKLILENKLPQTIGGGVGQSRLCMYLLQKKHIGEVQCSEWGNTEALTDDDVLML